MKEEYVTLPSKLYSLLDEVRYMMLCKLFSKEEKHGKDSVTNPDFDWTTYPLEPIEKHFVEEVGERLIAETEEEKMTEDIDVMNMAFIDYAMRAERLRKKND